MEDRNEPNINIGDLYPDLTPNQRGEAEQSLEEYIRVIEQIASRVIATESNVNTEDESVEDI